MHFFIHDSIDTKDPRFNVIQQKLLQNGHAIDDITTFPCYKRLHIPADARNISFTIGRIRFDDARILVAERDNKCYIMAAFWDHGYEKTWLLKMLGSARAPQWIKAFEAMLNEEDDSLSAAAPMIDTPVSLDVSYDDDALNHAVSIGSFSRLLVLSVTQADIASYIQAESPQNGSVILSLAGHGKTLLAEQLLKQTLAQDCSVIYVAPTKNLTNQMVLALKNDAYRRTHVSGSYAQGEVRRTSFNDKKLRFACETATDLLYCIAQLYDETRLLTFTYKEALCPQNLDEYLLQSPFPHLDSGTVHFEIFAVILGHGLTLRQYLATELSSLPQLEQQRVQLYRYYLNFLSKYNTHLNVYDLARKLIDLYRDEQFVMSDAGLLVIDEVHNIPPVFLALFKLVFSDMPSGSPVKQVLLGDRFQIHHPQYIRLDKQLQEIYGDGHVKFYELSQNWRVSQAIFSGVISLLSIENFAFGTLGDIRYQTSPICMQSEQGQISHVPEGLDTDSLCELLHKNPDTAFFTSDNTLRAVLKERGCVHVYASGEYQGLTFTNVILGDGFDALRSREMMELLRLYHEMMAERQSASCFNYQRPTHHLSLQALQRYELRKLALEASRATNTVLLLQKNPFLPSSPLPLEHGINRVAPPNDWLLSAQKFLKQGNLQVVIDILRSQPLWGDATLLPGVNQWLNLLLVKKSEAVQFNLISSILADDAFSSLFSEAITNPFVERQRWLSEQKHKLETTYSSTPLSIEPPAPNPVAFFSARSANASKADDGSLPLIKEPLKKSDELSDNLKEYHARFMKLLTTAPERILFKGFLTHSKAYQMLMTYKVEGGYTVWSHITLRNKRAYGVFLQSIYCDCEVTTAFLNILRRVLSDEDLNPFLYDRGMINKLISECDYRLQNIIDISGIDKARLIAELYNASKTLGNSHLANGPNYMTPQMASEYVSQNDFDYLQGRYMKINLSGPLMNYERYEQQVGAGTVWRIVAKIRSEMSLVTNLEPDVASPMPR